MTFVKKRVFFFAEKCQKVSKTGKMKKKECWHLLFFVILDILKKSDSKRKL